MILYEYEGKQLLKEASISVPRSVLITDNSPPITLNPPLVLKAQVLSGKRAEAGGIVIVEEIKDLRFKIKDLLGKTINKEKVERVLVEEKVEIEKEYYFSLSYDTDTRGPVLTISEQGGTGIEERGVKTFMVDPLTQTVIIDHVIASEAKQSLSGDGDGIASSSTTPRNDELVVNSEVLDKLIKLFFEQDCLLLEINPLVKTKKGEWLALDAKIKLDDDAKKRHEEWDFQPRLPGGRVPTQREIEAKKIDEGDYRGTAGSAYFDLEGDIAILSSGGGVSLTAMDALINVGGKPANFTEYSGNPPKEKVVKLTKIVLSKGNIHGLWVVGTVAANFTDIYETLSGLIEGLRGAEKELGKKFDFPIVIRRGGPRDKEAFEMLREVKDFNLTLQGEEVSISQSAKIMAELALRLKNYVTKK